MIVTLLTDFGLKDSYVPAMKGVILSRDPRIRIVDITHEVPPYDVEAAAFLLKSCFDDFPPRTVHLAVVDPGVGSARRPIAVSAAGHFFVGPDNGLFAEIAGSDASGRAYVIDQTRQVTPKTSVTFQGRDLFAPVAAALATGMPVASLGTAVDSLVQLPAVNSSPTATQGIRGRIQHVDRFGNCVTSLRPADFPGGEWRRSRWEVCAQRVGRSLDFYAEGSEPGELFTILGSTGYIEISVFLGSAAAVLGARVGDEVVAFP